MSEEISAQKVDKLIEDGGKPLEEALLEELEVAEGRPSAQQNAVNTETENANEEELDEELGDDEDEDSEEDSNESEDGSEDDGDAKHSGDESKGKQRKSNKNIKRLLNQRNSARDEAEYQKKRADELEAQLKSKEQDTGNDSDDEDSDESVDAKNDRKLAEDRETRKRQDRKKELDQKERDALIADYEPTTEELKAVDAFVEQNPNLSDETALRVVAPHYFVNEGKADRKNSRKLESGSKPRRNLRKDPSVEDMLTDDLEKHLKQEHKEGRLRI